LSVDGGNRQFRTERCLRETNRHAAEHVVVRATKEFMRIDRDLNEQIAAGTFGTDPTALTVSNPAPRQVVQSRAARFPEP
jgi:hypothetical protein